MTCIAWDGKTLAGDRLMSYGGTKIRMRKVHRITDKDGKRWLIGAAGDGPVVRHWIEWLRGKQERPTIPKDASFTALMIDSRHRAWQVEYSLVPYRVPAKAHAIGSGRGEALGAMAMGADAQQAVRIASKIDANCGLGVDCVAW